MVQGRKKGSPKTGGRLEGTPNTVTVAVREAALEYGPTAVAESARLMTEGRTDQVRIAVHPEYSSPLIILHFSKLPGQAPDMLKWLVILAQTVRSALRSRQDLAI
jgi:hypothetical protein